MRVLSLDVDGVLADEYSYLRSLTRTIPRLRGLSVADAAPYIWASPLPAGREFWEDRGPLYAPDAAAAQRALAALDGWDVQIVTRRNPEQEGVTREWVGKHYPWLPVARWACIGKGSKADHAPRRPDAAIDDSMTSLQEYLRIGVPMIAVRSYLTDPYRCLNTHTPIAANLGEALDLLVTLPVAR